ncbi:MAG: carbamoyl-phosphate synthase large subunit [Candidatus Altiarchaeota archaeon]
MPKRTDLRKIMIIGSGPIIIGQAAEFDYSGSQACKALRDEGYEVVLVNSNPATIMTDPEMADRTYVEPLTVESLSRIIACEKPDAILPTLGGQTALNLAIQLGDSGVLDEHGVELIGASLEAIKKAEDRELFKAAMQKIGLEVPKSGVAHNVDDALRIVEEIGYPIVARPAFTLGGTGGGIAYNQEELIEVVKNGLSLSMIGQVLLEEGLVGWKEFEYEVMRDAADNVVIICSIENFDPMGIHTGDSITVAPAQTLTDVEYQRLRDASIAVIREIGVDTGGSNIQFALHPRSDRLVVIEMNPRVSRSSSLASKATGFPIAKIAAKLAVGYTLDEIPNDITRETPSSFEPTIDYVVVKFPRFAFDKFPKADARLVTQMKSVGEVMSIGRTFEESLQKALRSLEVKRFGLAEGKENSFSVEASLQALEKATPDRVFHMYHALRAGVSVEKINSMTGIDPWFIWKIRNIIDVEEELLKTSKHTAIDALDAGILRHSKQAGFSDHQLASIFNSTDRRVREVRKNAGVNAVYKMVDTCAAEFDAKTPYYYSTYEDENDSTATDRKKVIVIGSGPNRIGQGVEFDYCCVHAVLSLKEQGYEAIMVNNNPETVSTDYDTSDRLYFEPITVEDVLNICENEKPEGVIVQFGGQTPLNIAEEISEQGVRILGTSPESINKAEDRKLFNEIIREVGIPQPEGTTVTSVGEAMEAAEVIGYPLMVRPSFVLGGRGMAIIYDESMLLGYAKTAVEVTPEHPMLMDKFLDDALEVEVDAVCDGEDVYIAAIMEHIELAGIHSGDSACVIPSRSISPENILLIEDYTRQLALKLDVVGLMNVQYAIHDDTVYILEANPRASRTVPYVSKVTGVPIAKMATKVIMGAKLRDLVDFRKMGLRYHAVKEAVFSFDKFPDVDPVLGPEMKSTGEVMGIDESFGLAFYKALVASGNRIPLEGTVLFSIADRDKKKMLDVARRMRSLGYDITATRGTKDYFEENGVECGLANKIHNSRPNIIDDMVNNKLQMVVNTPTGRRGRGDSSSIRRTAIRLRIPYITTTAAAVAAVEGLEALKASELHVKPIQDYHSGL